MTSPGTTSRLGISIQLPSRRTVGRRSNFFANAIYRTLRAIGLDEVQRHAQQDHQGDDRGIDDFAEGGGDRAGYQQDDGERICE